MALPQSTQSREQGQGDRLPLPIRRGSSSDEGERQTRIRVRLQRFSSHIPEYPRSIDVVYYRLPWGLIYPIEEDGRFYAVGGNTRIICESWGQAMAMCRRWESTGKCPVPDYRRLTPRSA